MSIVTQAEAVFENVDTEMSQMGISHPLFSSQSVNQQWMRSQVRTTVPRKKANAMSKRTFGVVWVSLALAAVYVAVNALDLGMMTYGYGLFGAGAVLALWMTLMVPTRPEA